jgi:phage/plasmid-like protein (TIGR03299 family)
MVAAVTVRKNGKAEMAFVGEKPWHGLGQQLTQGMPTKVWQVEAGMDWRVQRSKVRFATGPVDAADPAFAEWAAKHVLFRSDTRAPLGLVSDEYKVVQPAQVLEFFRELTEQNKFTLETAGTLFGGQRYWALARTNHELRIGGIDAIKGYLLLATSCDGSMKTVGKFVSERVVCSNTLAIALGEGGGAVKVSHASVFDETKVKMDLGLLDEQWAAFGETAERLASKKIARTRAASALVAGFGNPQRYEADLKTMTGMTKILKLFDGAGRGADMATAKDTEWGLINAVTEYLDHDYGRDQSNRLTSAWFGPNADRKARVMAYLTA